MRDLKGLRKTVIEEIGRWKHLIQRLTIVCIQGEGHDRYWRAKADGEDY